MPSLRQIIDEINARHTREILHALGGASLQDVQGVLAGLRRERLSSTNTTRASKSRRSSAKSPHAVEIDAANIVAHLKEHGPLRSEELRRALNMSREDTSKALALGLEWKMVSKKGEKRATTYKALKQRGPKVQLTVGDRMRVAAVLGK